MSIRALQKEHGLWFLGLLHTGCLVAMATGSAYYPFAEACMSALIAANALVAVGVTLPLSGKAPANKLWSSLSVMWLLAGYAVASILVRYFAKTVPAHAEAHPYTYTNYWELAHSLGTRDVMIAFGCAIPIALLVGGLRWGRLKSSGLSLWAMLAVLGVAMVYNRPLILIPSYVMIAFGFYVAFFALGREWVWRAVAAAAVGSLVPCVFVLRDFWIAHGSAVGSLSPAALFMALRELPAIVPGVQPDITARWLVGYIPLTFGLAAAQRSRWGRWTLLIIGIVQVLAILAGGRKSAYLFLAALIPASFILFKSAKLSKAGVYMIVALTLITCIATTKNPLIDGAVERGLVSHQLVSRGHQWSCNAALDQFVKHPIVGVGLGNYFGEYQEWKWSRLPGETDFGEMDCASPFSDYYDLLAQGGLVLFLLVCALATQVWLGVRPLLLGKKPDPLKYVVLGYAVQILALAPSMAAGLAIFTKPQWLIPNGALIVAILAVSRSRGETAENQEGSLPA